MVDVDAFSYQQGYQNELAASLIKLQIQNLSSMVSFSLLGLHPDVPSPLPLVLAVTDRPLGCRLAVLDVQLLPPHPHRATESHWLDIGAQGLR